MLLQELEGRDRARAAGTEALEADELSDRQLSCGLTA